jgi:hypothetical protein
VQTLGLLLSDSQYERLRDEAELRHISISDLVLEVIDASLRSEATGNRYASLARKQALWRARPGVERQPQPGMADAQFLCEQVASYAVRPDRGIYAELADLRLDLIYHSEA